VKLVAMLPVAVLLGTGLLVAPSTAQPIIMPLSPQPKKDPPPPPPPSPVPVAPPQAGGAQGAPQTDAGRNADDTTPRAAGEGGASEGRGESTAGTPER
jgi:hypothetical protein